MLIDEVRISAKAGSGGSGIAHLYHDRHRPKGGPDGGSGGNGGSIYFEAVADITRLNQFQHKTKIEAENGHSGGINQMTGKNGADLILKVPVGTVVNYDNGTGVELTRVGEIVMIAKGGRGGWGNFHYRAADNRTPTEFQSGEVKEAKNLFIQLKLIAQAGLIGLPNAGKSSLLNELTAAQAKVANYPFTTLEPNLGVMPSGHVLADIPGLIEGASAGRGLGVKFLKHVERTQLLIHCLPADSTDPLHDYQLIRQELAAYSSSLAAKPELIIITKSDLATVTQLTKIKKLVNSPLSVSILDDNSIHQLAKLINSKLQQPKPVPSSPSPSL